MDSTHTAQIDQQPAAKPQTVAADYVSADDVAILLGVSLRQVQRLTSKQLVPFYKIGRNVRYRYPEIQVALARLRVKAIGE
jgi:excisionase family DNA binding protein